MIPVLDDFNRAHQQIDKGENAIDVEGIKLIYNKFSDVLKNNGLTSTEAEIGDVFDAEIHEAITQIPAPSEKEKGKIIDIVETGYQLGDRIIRYPKVVVGQ
jgi:molecular chaperone GrpE